MHGGGLGGMGGGRGGRWGGRRANVGDDGKPLPRLHSSKQYHQRFREQHRQPQQKPDTTESGPDTPDRATRRRYLRQYAAWLRPHAWGLIGVFMLALVGVGGTVVMPVLSQQIIDKAVLIEGLVYSERVQRLAFFGGAMAVVSLIGFGVDTLRDWVVAVLNAKLVFRLRQRLFDRLLSLSLDELSDMKSGGVVSRLSGDVDSTTGLVQMGLISPALAAVQSTAALVIIFLWNWRLAVGLAVILPVLVGLHLFWVRRIRPIYRSMREDRSTVDGRVTETFGGIRVVRAFRRESHERSDYAVGHHTVIRKSLFAQILQMIVHSGWRILMPAVSVSILWYGGYLVVRDANMGVVNPTTVGQLFAFQWYIFLLIGPVIRIVDAMSQTQRALAAMERVFDVLDRAPDKPDAPDAVEAPRNVRDIAFEQVTFAYREGVPVIQDFCLTVPGGSVVALVGPSGAGKTTLTDLLARFQDPTEGSIRLNGLDLRRLKLATYRSLFAVVQQDVFLFDGTVRENIAYGRRGAAEAEIIDAARRANADRFITELPEGYDTFIGERGVKLSGGQRQRLSIARAILADPQILILDEATSNLDTESEQLIQAALADLYANRTTFVIAHRLSTITHADLIVVMDRGRIVEVGRHEQLIAAGGMYRDMVERQGLFTAEPT